MADFSAFYWSRHIFAGDRHWMDREAAVALKKLKMVSMPSRAYTSFLRYPFKNLGFMRFPEPVFAGICQNILTNPHFRACLQFGHI